MVTNTPLTIPHQTMPNQSQEVGRVLRFLQIRSREIIAITSTPSPAHHASGYCQLILTGFAREGQGFPKPEPSHCRKKFT